MSPRLIETHTQVANASSSIAGLFAGREIRLLPLRSLKPAKQNARTHPRKQIKQLQSVMLRFGWTSPIVVDENLTIVCGHARYEAAKGLGLENVPILIMTGLSEAEKRALAIADNKIPTNARWDRGVLAVELGELATLLTECDLDLRITGFEPAEIGRFVTGFGNSNGVPSEEPPKISDQAISRRGDCWHCGDHRLFCGDASDRSDWAALMGDEKAIAVFADPPHHRARHADDMPRSECADELRIWMRLAAEFSTTGSISFHLHGLAAYRRDAAQPGKRGLRPATGSRGLGQAARRPRSLLPHTAQARYLSTGTVPDSRLNQH